VRTRITYRQNHIDKIFTILPLSPLVDSVHDRSWADEEEEEEEREMGVESFQLE